MQNTARARIRRISVAALLIAFTIIFTRFVGIDFGFSRVSLGQVPVMMASIILGPIYGSVVGVAADILGNGFRYGFGATLPWPIISAVINGTLPWLLFKLFRKIKDRQPKVPIIAYLFVIIWLLISIIVWSNDEINIPIGGGETTSIALTVGWKIIVPIGLALILIALFVIVYFINKYFEERPVQNKDCPSPYEVALFVFITSFIVSVIWGPIWKSFTWATYGYLPILALESVIFTITYPLTTFFVSFLLSIYYRYIDKTNLETKSVKK